MAKYDKSTSTLNISAFIRSRLSVLAVVYVFGSGGP